VELLRLSEALLSGHVPFSTPFLLPFELALSVSCGGDRRARHEPTVPMTKRKSAPPFPDDAVRDGSKLPFLFPSLLFLHAPPPSPTTACGFLEKRAHPSISDFNRVAAFFFAFQQPFSPRSDDPPVFVEFFVPATTCVLDTLPP